MTIDTKEPTFATLPEALERAKADASTAGGDRYVLLTVVPGGYTVLRDMPMMGQWWTADGIRHGSPIMPPRGRDRRERGQIL